MLVSKPWFQDPLGKSWFNLISEQSLVVPGSLFLSNYSRLRFFKRSMKLERFWKKPWNYTRGGRNSHFFSITEERMFAWEKDSAHLGVLQALRWLPFVWPLPVSSRPCSPPLSAGLDRRPCCSPDPFPLSFGDIAWVLEQSYCRKYFGFADSFQAAMEEKTLLTGSGEDFHSLSLWNCKRFAWQWLSGNLHGEETHFSSTGHDSYWNYNLIKELACLVPSVFLEVDLAWAEHRH